MPDTTHRHRYSRPCLLLDQTFLVDVKVYARALDVPIVGSVVVVLTLAVGLLCSAWICCGYVTDSPIDCGLTRVRKSNKFLDV